MGVQRPGVILFSPSFPGILTRRHSLEGHLSRAIGIQQGTEDQPARVSIVAVGGEEDRRLVRLSKYLSKYLRHRPEELGLALMPGGWVEVDALLAASARRGFHISRDELEEVVTRNDKKRFAFDESGTLIRAQQGHSAPVDLELEPATPPATLYHGTPERNLTAIVQDGLLKMRRHHVHLSPDEATARTVGARRGRPVVLAVDAEKMHRDGYVFYRSGNEVWLVEHVSPRYLSRL